jgi:ABC-type branched-subunit amino acid transport system ATPase component
MSQQTQNPVLRAEGVIAGYRPDLPILHGVGVEVRAGEVATIIGPNGAGKSTLIKAIAGLVAISSGSVLLDGEDITGQPAHQLATLGAGFVPQTGNVFATLTIQENLILGGIGLHRSEAGRRTQEIYQRYPMLGEKRHDKAATLSGGQRQILAVARVLIMRPRLILLDEPTAGLSPMAAAELFQLVRALAADGAAVLMVEQNARAALKISDTGFVLAEGQNRLSGPAAALLEDAKVGQIFLGQRGPAKKAVKKAAKKAVKKKAAKKAARKTSKKGAKG